MLSFFLKEIWIGIDDFLLNFLATSGSILGLQITVTFGSVLGPVAYLGFRAPGDKASFGAPTQPAHGSI